MRTDELIGRLATELQPVRRLSSPGRRAALWLGFAALVIGAFTIAVGPRHDLMDYLSDPHEAMQLAFMVATGVLSAVAAFQLALPDRSGHWVLLPLPAALLWGGSLGMGCMAEVARLGPEALAFGTAWSCFRFIVLMGVPLAASMVWMLRHAGPVRPVPVAVLGGLAGAALSSAGLSLFHHLEAALMVLFWHGGGTLLVVLGFLLAGRRWQAREATRFTAV
ncbi:DUF1109 domain-containing protein [Roseomonas terrae]|uniref:DUF1109 domain-containing protein n=1 Tax=Neoroseomonas terrae TaxID=424799 RepID=A0ABS5ELA7_9PROT|nr:DUF1109 domain-containing protein [Neoroseomonas terrae]